MKQKKRKYNIRDSKGRFTKIDKRKKVIKSGFGQVIHSTSKKMNPPDAAQRNTIDITQYVDRKKDEDLYAYFQRKKINQKIQALQKKHKNKVIIARVKTQVNGRHFYTSFFRVTDLFKKSRKGKEEIRFIGGRRKGRKYTSKDVIAYFIHDSINKTDYRLYARKTDTHEQIVKKGSGLYATKGKFEIHLQAVSKKSGRSVQTVTSVGQTGNTKHTASSKSSSRKKVGRKNIKRK